MCLQVLCKDPRTLAAGGGVEMEIAQQLGEMARKETGLEQYAIGKFAEALEVRSFSALLPAYETQPLQTQCYWPTTLATVPYDNECTQSRQLTYAIGGATDNLRELRPGRLRCRGFSSSRACSREVNSRDRR